MLLLHAQGGGFYGCAVATVELSLQEATERLRRAMIGTLFGDANHGAAHDPGINLELGEDSFVLIRQAPAGLPPIPTPIVLMDSGHADEDEAALHAVLHALA